MHNISYVLQISLRTYSQHASFALISYTYLSSLGFHYFIPCKDRRYVEDVLYCSEMSVVWTRTVWDERYSWKMRWDVS